MPTEAYALCPVVPHLSEKGYTSYKNRVCSKDFSFL